MVDIFGWKDNVIVLTLSNWLNNTTVLLDTMNRNDPR